MKAKVFTREELEKAMEKTRRRENRRKKIHNTVNKVEDWINDNRDLIVSALPIAIPAIGYITKTGVGAVKAVNRNRRLAKEENLKKLYCYDRSLGHYWVLRRELSNNEWVEIDKRKAKGERLADILDELKVLK